MCSFWKEVKVSISSIKMEKNTLMVLPVFGVLHLVMVSPNWQMQLRNRCPSLGTQLYLLQNLTNLQFFWLKNWLKCLLFHQEKFFLVSQALILTIHNINYSLTQIISWGKRKRRKWSREKKGITELLLPAQVWLDCQTNINYLICHKKILFTLKPHTILKKAKKERLKKTM